MPTVSVHGAKTHLSRLPARVGAGEGVVVARSGKPGAPTQDSALVSNETLFGRHGVRRLG